MAGTIGAISARIASGWLLDEAGPRAKPVRYAPAWRFALFPRLVHGLLCKITAVSLAWYTHTHTFTLLLLLFTGNKTTRPGGQQQQ